MDWISNTFPILRHYYEVEWNHFDFHSRHLSIFNLWSTSIYEVSYITNWSHTEKLYTLEFPQEQISALLIQLLSLAYPCVIQQRDRLDKSRNRFCYLQRTFLQGRPKLIFFINKYRVSSRLSVILRDLQEKERRAKFKEIHSLNWLKSQIYGRKCVFT